MYHGCREWNLKYHSTLKPAGKDRERLPDWYKFFTSFELSAFCPFDTFPYGYCSKNKFSNGPLRPCSAYKTQVHFESQDCIPSTWMLTVYLVFEPSWMTALQHLHYPFYNPLQIYRFSIKPDWIICLLDATKTIWKYKKW